jgi:hypothetical protein
MIKISPAMVQSAIDPQRVNATEMVSLIDANRARIRTLGTMIITIGGMLLSSSFVILFFIFNGGSAAHHLQAITLLFLSTLMSSFAIFSSLISATLPLPVAAPTKMALLNATKRIYDRELLWVRVSTFTLLASVLVFALALVVFEWRILSTHATF